MLFVSMNKLNNQNQEMPGELNYYSRYSRRKNNKTVPSLMRKFQIVRPSTMKIISAYHNYAQKLVSSIQEAEEKLQTEQSQQQSSRQSLQTPNHHEGKQQSQNYIQKQTQLQKDIETQKPSINILHTFSVHESVGGSDEEELSEVIKEDENIEDVVVEDREDNQNHSYSFEDVFQDKITFRNSDVSFVNKFIIDSSSKSEKLIRAINYNIEVEERIEYQNEALLTEQPFETHQQIIQPIQQFSLEFKVHKLQQIPQTKSSNSEEGRPEHSKIQEMKYNDRKPFKKVMQSKKLNPRLVTSTIMNDQQKPKKVNFKKVLKQLNVEQEGERKEKKIIMKEKRKSGINELLLQAFFQQN